MKNVSSRERMLKSDDFEPPSRGSFHSPRAYIALKKERHNDTSEWQIMASSNAKHISPEITNRCGSLFAERRTAAILTSSHTYREHATVERLLAVSVSGEQTCNKEHHSQPAKHSPASCSS